jgi:hypothetical protein
MIDPEQIDRYVFDPETPSTVGGMVRSMRNGMLVEDRNKSEHDDFWVKSFYRWGRINTECRGVYVGPNDDDTEYASVANSIMAQIEKIRLACSDRLTNGFRKNGFHEQQEVLASLGLYACDIAVSAGISGAASHAQGAILIRSLAEINILASHISKNPDSATLYREYGAGRAALLTAKIGESGSSANYLFVEELSAVSNERRAAIFIDMPVNGFYKKSIRDTAIECGAKDVYDSYYDIGSMYGHAEWGGVATSSVQACLNPLHLGHYVPSQRMFATEMLKDVSWLINRLTSQLEVSA